MITFTAKQLHDNPSEVYRAAAKEPVRITHKFHGEFTIYCDNDSDENEKIISDFSNGLLGMIKGA